MGDFLYKHQRAALEKMHNGCILCGDTGLGKSRTALAYYYTGQRGSLSPYKRMKNPQDLYIFTTAQNRDRGQWEHEFGPFGIGNAEVYSNKVVVDSWNNIAKYADVSGAFIIFDEDRVTGKGKWAKTFIKLAKVNKWIILSATPGDTWEDYAAVFIANGFYKNRTEFNRRHVTYKPFRNFHAIDHTAYRDVGRLLKFRRRVIVDMPSPLDRGTVPHHESVICEYDKAAYRDICKTRWNPWTDEPIGNAAEFCACLRRVVNTSDDRQLKLLEIVEKHPRVIIFYNYNYELEILRRICYGLDYRVTEWNGHQHQRIATDSDRWIHLVQYAAGAEAWNCIETDTMIFFSQNYSYKIMTQSAGRIDRLNTPYVDLYYYHLKSRAGIDLAISKALARKEKFNEREFDEGDV